MIFDIEEWEGVPVLRSRLRKKGLEMPDYFAKLISENIPNSIGCEQLIQQADEASEFNFRRDIFSSDEEPIKLREIQEKWNVYSSESNHLKKVKELYGLIDELKENEAERILPTEHELYNVIDGGGQKEFLIAMADKLGFKTQKFSDNQIKNWQVYQGCTFMGWIGIRALPVYKDQFLETANVDLCLKIGLVSPKKYVVDFNPDQLVWGWDFYKYSFSLSPFYAKEDSFDLNLGRISTLSKMAIWSNLVFVQVFVELLEEGIVKPKVKYLTRLGG